MNAPEALSQMRKPTSNGIALRLKTLTPLYTGGIGQTGDQVHPSNLLGSIRHFSCLVARTLGDARFEAEVWGNAGSGEGKAAAKRLALHWDTTRLLVSRLPGEITIPKDGGNSRWWFSTAWKGEVDLTVTPLSISDEHWKILRLALAIQLRHASFGAKDQFGLGVLTPAALPVAIAQPLDPAASYPAAILDDARGRLNLLRYAFGKLRFGPRPGQRPQLTDAHALTLALGTRATLRNALRAAPDAPEAERNRLTQLRHRMLGKLNQFGSAVNVSAAYPSGEGVELRLTVALKPESKEERAEVFKNFRAAIANIDAAIEKTGYRVAGPAEWEFGGAQGNDKKAAWLNKLAGV